jgi:hypothetical protein
MEIEDEDTPLTEEQQWIEDQKGRPIEVVSEGRVYWCGRVDPYSNRYHLYEKQEDVHRSTYHVVNMARVEDLRPLRTPEEIKVARSQFPTEILNEEWRERLSNETLGCNCLRCGASQTVAWSLLLDKKQEFVCGSCKARFPGNRIRWPKPSDF